MMFFSKVKPEISQLTKTSQYSIADQQCSILGNFTGAQPVQGKNNWQVVLF